MVSREEFKGAEDALKWAARTYLVAALGSLATLEPFTQRVKQGRYREFSKRELKIQLPRNYEENPCFDCIKNQNPIAFNFPC